MQSCKEVAPTATRMLRVLLLLLFGGCAAAPDRTASRLLPDYAVAVGNQAWAVTCGNATISGDWNQDDGFFNSDGSQKSHQRFCNDIQARSRIRR